MRRKICVFDIETNYPEGWDFLFAGVLGEGIEYTYFTSVSELFLFMKSIAKDYVFFCHGDFDIRYIFQFVREAGLNFKCLLNSSRILRFNVGNLELRNTLMLVPAALKDIGATIGVEKMNLDASCKDFESFLEYNKRDCEILLKFLLELRKEFGDIYLTYGSMAIRELIKQVNVQNVSDEVNEDLRKFYFGGKCEIYKIIHKGKVFKYDINSFYPYQMRKGIPVYYLGLEKDFKKIRNLPEDVVAFVRGKWYSDGYIPFLPVKTKKGNFYPVGEIEGIYISDFLKYLKLIRFDYAHLFMLDIKNVKSFIDKFYELKKQGGVKRIIGKLILNSSYGKFAERGVGQVIIRGKFKPGDIVISDDCCVRSEEYEQLVKNVAVSSLITQRGIIDITNYCRKFNAMYCDTDSIFTDKEIETSEDLGDFKLEAEADFAHFILPKVYVFGDELKAKGITHAEIVDGRVIGIDYRFAGILTALKNFKSLTEPIEFKREVKSLYMRRKIKGNYTFPLDISEIQNILYFDERNDSHIDFVGFGLYNFKKETRGKYS